MCIRDRADLHDLVLHVEAQFHQVAVILLQLKQEVVAAVPVLLASRCHLAIVLVHDLHVLLVQR